MEFFVNIPRKPFFSYGFSYLENDIVDERALIKRIYMHVNGCTQANCENWWYRGDLGDISKR